MRNLFIWCSLSAMFSLPVRVLAQGVGNFYPPGTTLYDSVGTKPLSFTAHFDAFSSDSSVPVFFRSPIGVTCQPSQVTVPQNFYGIDFPLQITVYPDSIAPCPDAEVDACVGSANGPITSAFIVNGYIYNSKIMGHLHAGKDTLDFGQVTLGKDDSLLLPIDLDTCGSIFRYLWPREVKAPFAAPDSIIPDPCQCWWTKHNFYVHFRPTGIKAYLDTAYIYDPLRGDSIQFILLGEGVAAGVGPAFTESDSLRINPNPCDRSAAISLLGEDIEEVTVQNMLGERVLELHPHVSGLVNLNTSVLPAGIYYVEARSGEDVFRQRIVVRH